MRVLFIRNNLLGPFFFPSPNTKHDATRNVPRPTKGVRHNDIIMRDRLNISRAGADNGGENYILFKTFLAFRLR